MSRDRDPVRINLLESDGVLGPAVMGYDDSRSGYELQSVDHSDIGNHKGPVSSQYPLPYSSTWDSYQEDHRNQPAAYHELRKLRTTSVSSAKPAVKNALERAIRFVLRSGAYASHISYERANPNRAYKPSAYSGWRGGCLAAAVSTMVVLLVNLTFTIWAALQSKSGVDVGVIFEGQCDQVSRINSVIHIFINILGTLLLGASNFTMQCISSPTRSEVDAAHSKGRYLDIGLPSLRNLTGWRKRVLFWLLVLSTLPLHFFWNSAVFTTTQQLDYNVYVVTPDFFSLSAVDCSTNVSILYQYLEYSQRARHYKRTPLSWEGNINPNSNESYKAPSSLVWYQRDVCNISNALLSNTTKNVLAYLSKEDCIKTYGGAKKHLSNWGNVLVVTEKLAEDSNSTILFAFRYEKYVSNYTGDNWVCGPKHLISNGYQCDYSGIAANSNSWTLGPIQGSPENDFAIAPTTEYPIDYCLGQKLGIGGNCLLQYSLVLMLSVIAANLVKFLCMVVVLKTQFEPILATIGDGIASFLERPDKTTPYPAFLTRNEARKFQKKFLLERSEMPSRWQKPKLRWWHAPSRPRWIITLFLCAVSLIITASLLADRNTALMLENDDFPSPWSLGFGQFHSEASLNGFTNVDFEISKQDFTSSRILIGIVAVANLPQVIVSSIYFAYNTVYTSMVSADEWSRFTTHRKALRTTDPRGEQRSTYWLSLPWTYALPLAAASAFLHWLISQSLFVARTEVLDTYGNPEPISLMVIGYSPLAILLATLFGLLLTLSMIANGFRRLRPCVLVGNNSLAIAAACQRPENDVGAELKKVSWGAVKHEDRDGKPGHCCFTSLEVEHPREGDMYE